MVPFFGGRSTLWSAWCPTPTRDEMQGWPEKIIKAAENQFGSALKLLRVKPADRLDQEITDQQRSLIGASRPVYGRLQSTVQRLLKDGIHNIEGVYRSEPAPLACASETGVDFQKYSTPGDLLALVVDPGQGKKV